MAICLLIDAGLPKRLLTYAVLCLVQCTMDMYRAKPNKMLELRKVFLWIVTGPALHFLYITHIKTVSKKESDESSSQRCLRFLMKVLNYYVILLNQ